jgi:hypothetical protein
LERIPSPFSVSAIYWQDWSCTAMRRLQRRRAQTEARIGIFKANFLGDHLPTKNWPAQQRFVAWATIAHNLWVLARLDQVAKPLAEAI